MLKKLRDVKWGWQEDHIGKVVQRYKNSLIPICKQSGEGWTDIFLSWPHGFIYRDVDQFKVRILKLKRCADNSIRIIK